MKSYLAKCSRAAPAISNSFLFFFFFPPGREISFDLFSAEFTKLDSEYRETVGSCFSENSVVKSRSLQDFVEGELTSN